MIRRLVAGLIVVGLAVGIWVLWPRDDSEPTPTTVPEAGATTNPTTVTFPPTTTSMSSSSTTTSESAVVSSVEEAEAIVKELPFRRLLAIFNQSEEELSQVVASERSLTAGIDAFGRVHFEREPYEQGVELSGSELLRSDSECIALWTTLDASAFQGPDSISSAVVILRSVESQWRWASLWQHRDDLWEADCDAQLDPVS